MPETTLLFPFRQIGADGKWGYMDPRGSTVIEPRFDAAGDFSERRALVTQGGRRRCIDERGRTVFLVPDRWVLMRPFSEGRAVFLAEDDLSFQAADGTIKFGFCDLDGNVAVKPKYSIVRPFSEGLAAVGILSNPLSPDPIKWGFVDKNGMEVIAPRFSLAGSFSEGLAWVSLESGVALVDKTGEIAIRLDRAAVPERWYRIDHGYSEGLCPVCVTEVMAVPGSENDGLPRGRRILERFGFIDRAKRFVIGPEFSWAGAFHEGRAQVEIGEQVAFCDPTGRLIGIRWFDEARSFSEGLAAVRMGEYWCYVNRQMDVAIGAARARDGRTQPINDAEDFSAGLARVHIGGNLVRWSGRSASWYGGVWYYINRKGEIVRRVRHDEEEGPGYGREIR